MRRSKFLTLLLALMFALTAMTGCMGSGDEGDGSNDGGGTGTGTGDGTGDGTGTGDGSSGGDGGDGSDDTDTGDGTDGGDNATEPPAQKPAPVNETVTLTMNAGVAPAQPAHGEATFTVPQADWATFTVTITPMNVHADSVTVAVVDPDGEQQGTAQFQFSAEEGEPQELTITAGAAGDWMLTADAGTLAQGAEFECQITIEW